jgi:tetraprenyl-beta-curcumene synthase
VGTVVALGLYQARIVPRVRYLLGTWRDAAATIPNPNLRAQALAAIDEKGANVEAAAVFATLAPRRRRATALRAMVALQVAIDYLDSLGEQEHEQPLKNGLQLHRALEAAVAPGGDPEDWYRFHPDRDDGGYLNLLVTACRESLASLPAHQAVHPRILRAVRRCGEGQSRTHAVEQERRDRGRSPSASLGAAPGGLASWAAGLEAPPIYRWWEVAAGASSSVAIHALIAAAAEARTASADAELIERAYFPPIGALTVLLDDLIDREEDAAAGSHNYLAYYPDSSTAANRLELIARLADAALVPLRRQGRQRAILNGVIGFYLSVPAADSPYAKPIGLRLLAAGGGGVAPIIVMRRRRGLTAE